MKRVFALVITVMMICQFIPVIAANAMEPDKVSVMHEFYVSPTGNDKNNGDKANPFLTLQRAKAAVREINSDMTGDIYVYLAEGIYEIDKTIVFTKEDSGTNGYDIHYEAMDGNDVVLSGGKRITGKWTNEGNGIYSTPYKRDRKLRSLYVNGERCYMTSDWVYGRGGYETFDVKTGQADWAWIDGTAAVGVKFDKGEIPLDTRNQDDIEFMTQTTWNTAIVCAEELVETQDGMIAAMLQQPYGAIAQQPAWNNAYKLYGNQRAYNVFEWLNDPGEFYFDKSADKLYYYPRANEDVNNMDVVVPEIDTIISVEGANTDNHVTNLVFKGITFSDTDWNLYEIEGSHGRATVQGAAGIISFSEGRWHGSIYRGYDVGKGAIEVTSADNIAFYNNVIEHTGNDGLSLINDVSDITVDGNVFYDAAGSAVLIGHPQHVYIGDKGSSKGSFSEREKYDVGVEGVCKKIDLTNNFIYEPARLFWGDSGVMVFHAEELAMKYNHIEETPYSGLSLGWGWWNMNGESGSVVPGEPSTTTKNNTIVSNAFINNMTTLGDAGAIYTLGDMPGTVISGNYIDTVGHLEGGNHKVRGIHADEGTRHVYGENNVLVNIPEGMGVIDCGYWGRKGNNTWHHNYSVSDMYTSDYALVLEPGTVITEMQISPYRIWGKDVFDILAACGIKGSYIKNAPKEFYPVQDRLLSEAFYIKGGEQLDFNFSDGDIDGEVWLAQENTTVFTENEKTVKVKNGEVNVPIKDGEYRLFVVNGSDVSKPSYGKIIVYSDSLIENIAESTYRVSYEKPLEIELKSEYVRKAVLNGEEVENGHKIQSSGEYTLSVTSLSDEVETVTFSTYVAEVDIVFDRDFATISGNALINPTDKTAWFVPAESNITEVSQLVESDIMTVSKGTNVRTVPVPKKFGEYKIVLVDENTISEYSHATLLVSDGGLKVTDNLLLRLNAEDITLDENTPVSEWKDSVGGIALVQNNDEKKPLLKRDENGMKYLYFDGTDDFLELQSGKVLDMNNKSNLTIIAFSSYEGEDPGGSNGDTKATVFFPESGSWGALFLSPYRNSVMARFGSGQSNNVHKHIRSEAKEGFVVTAAVKNGKSEYLYDNGEKVLESNSKKESTANIKPVMYVGKTAASRESYLQGGVSEILIYDRSLTEEEITLVQSYMNMKMVLATINTYVDYGEKVLTGENSHINMDAFRNAHYEMLELRSRIIKGENVSAEDIDNVLNMYNDSCFVTVKYLSLTGAEIRESEEVSVSPFDDEYMHTPEKSLMTNDGIYELAEDKSVLVCNVAEKPEISLVYKKTYSLGENYVTNGSFEDENGGFSLEGWNSAKTNETLGDPYITNDVYAVSENSVITNSQSTEMKTEIPDGKWALGTLWHESFDGLRSIKRYVKVDAGKTYMISYKVRHTTGNNGSYIKTSIVGEYGAGENETAEGIGDIGTQWTTITRVFEATEERDYVLFLFRWLGDQNNNGSGGPYWMFDDFSIREMVPCLPFEYTVSESDNKLIYNVDIKEYGEESVVAIVAQYDENDIMVDVVKKPISLTEKRSFEIEVEKKSEKHKLILLESQKTLKPL